ncbi:MAG: hypothetical protein AAF907_07840 [Planctomycetota bacterium]
MTWLAILAGLAALLLLVGPLIAAVVLVAHGRYGWAGAAAAISLAGLLVAGVGLLSVRTVAQEDYRRAATAQHTAQQARLEGFRERAVHMELMTRFANDDRVRVDDDGVYVIQKGVEIQVGPPAPWRDAAQRHEERLLELHRAQQRRDPSIVVIESDPPGDEPAVPAELVSEDDLPKWVSDPGDNRVVVVGPLVTDEDGGPQAARRAAEGAILDRLAPLANLPADAEVNPRDVPNPGRVAILSFNRSTGENEFTLYQGYLQVDASSKTLDRLRRGYQNRLGEERAAWAVGGAGGCVAFFASLWGLGRRQLRRA